MYDHDAKKGDDRHAVKKDLSIYDFELLPNYIKNNKEGKKNKKNERWASLQPTTPT